MIRKEFMKIKLKDVFINEMKEHTKKSLPH